MHAAAFRGEHSVVVSQVDGQKGRVRHLLTTLPIVFSYAAKVFAQTGRQGPSAALLANGISSAILLVGTVSLTLLLDTYGRRKPIFCGRTTTAKSLRYRHLLTVACHYAGPLLMGLCLSVVGAMLVAYGSPHFDYVTSAVQFTFENAAAGNAAIAFMFLL